MRRERTRIHGESRGVPGGESGRIGAVGRARADGLRGPRGDEGRKEARACAWSKGFRGRGVRGCAWSKGFRGRGVRGCAWPTGCRGRGMGAPTPGGGPGPTDCRGARRSADSRMRGRRGTGRSERLAARSARISAAASLSGTGRARIPVENAPGFIPPREARHKENLLSSGSAPCSASSRGPGASFMAKPECRMIRLIAMYGDCVRSAPFPRNRQ